MKGYIKVYLIVAVTILLFARLGLAGNTLNEKEVYCKYKTFYYNLKHDLKIKLDNTDSNKEIYKACVNSAYIKCQFRRNLYLEYNINGQKLERIMRKGKRRKWSCSWFD